MTSQDFVRLPMKTGDGGRGTGDGGRGAGDGHFAAKELLTSDALLPGYELATSQLANS